MNSNRVLSSLISVSLLVAALSAAPASGVWQENGYPVCTAVNCQANARLIPDGMGGAFVCWDDKRGGLTEDLYVQHLDADGDAYWQSQGVPFCTAANSQYWPRMVRDGTGGIIVVWQDLRAGTHTNLYARRIDESGTPVWAANGVAICTSADEQQYTRIISDGAGGAIVAWEDWRSGEADLFVQHVNILGNTAWTADGVRASSSAPAKTWADLAPDGIGGAILVWQDGAGGGDHNIATQRLNASGTLQWGENGVTVCANSAYQHSPRVVPDETGGAIVAWEDRRNESAGDIYA